MATSYTPNAKDPTEPTTARFVESAAAEFRALKSEVAEVRTLATSGGGTGSATVTKQSIIDAVVADGQTVFPFTRTAQWTTDAADHCFIVTRTASYTGGGNDSFGNRRAAYAFAGVTTTNATASNCESGVFGGVQSYANIDPTAAALGQTWPQNIGISGHAIQYGTAPVFGGWLVAQNKSGIPQVASRGALVGLEINIGLTGSDQYASTVGIDCVPQAMATGACNAFTAFRASGTAVTNWQFGFIAQHTSLAGFLSQSTDNPTGSRAFWATGSYAVAIDTSMATNTLGTAIRIKAGDCIALDGNDQYKMKLNGSLGRIEFYNNATPHGYIDLVSGANVDLAGGSANLAAYAQLQNAVSQTFTGTNVFTGSVTMGNSSSTAIYLGQTQMTGSLLIDNNWIRISGNKCRTRPATPTLSGIQLCIFIDDQARYIDLYLP